MNSTDNSQNTRAGEMPPGRPPQTDFNAVFHNELDYPRLGNVTFRRGTLTDNQHELFEKRWPELGRVLEDEVIDLASWFGRSGAKTIVEIGSGTGTSTAAMAPKEADTNIIAVELYKPGLAKLLGQIEREGIDNIRMIRGDGIEVMVRMFAPESLDGIRVFFPDPWPKARHHKRRIVQPAFAELVRSKLKIGGVLHMATDWENYAEHMLEVMNAAPGYRNLAADGTYVPRPEERLVTKFERRGERLGHGVWDLKFQRQE